MATYTQRNGAWFAQIRRKGHKSISRTFDTKADAERWALSIESGMGVGTYVDNRDAIATSLRDCLMRYEIDITPHKKSAQRESQRIKFLLRDPIVNRGIGTIKPMDMALWRDARIASGVTGTTVNKDLALISHLFTIAIKEWGMPLTNPVKQIRKPKENRARDRRLSADEEKSVFDYCTPEMQAFIILALETSMRRSEIANLKRSDITGCVAFLEDTKNGDSRAVPLSTLALAAINSLPVLENGKLFQYKSDAYTRAFKKARDSAGITNLRLHDLRHEATSRFFEKGFEMMEVSTITGHKSMQMLKRYTHLKAEELAKRLG